MALLLSGACAVSLLSVNSASTGGNSATYLIGEGKGAQRNLPRILLGSTVMVIVFDVALSAARKGQGEVGCIAARYVVGPAGAAALSVILPRGTKKAGWRGGHQPQSRTHQSPRGFHCGPRAGQKRARVRGCDRNRARWGHCRDRR